MTTELPLSLEKLFQNRLFQIPDYQRGYAWEETQWLEFLDDLELLGEGQKHYTGTVILKLKGWAKVRDEEGTENEWFEVVDGQQRLTTAALLLECIARRFEALGSRQAKGIRKKYLTVMDDKGNPIYKLRLQSDQQPLFVNHVIENNPVVDMPSTLAGSRLLEARSFFDAHLDKQANILGDHFGNWIETLCDKLTHKIVFLRYEVDDRAEVGMIFEVTNDRGKQLSELEKVKNYLLYLATKVDGDRAAGLEERVNRLWGDIFRRLMERRLIRREEEDALLRVHWLLGYDVDERNWSGAKSVKDRLRLRNYFGREADLRDELRSYLGSLQDAAFAYMEIAVPNHPSSFCVFGSAASEAKQWVEKIHRLGVLAPFVPLLTACRVRWARTPDRFIELTKSLERLSFRLYRIEGYRSQAARSALFRLGSEVWRGTLSTDATFERLRGLASDYLRGNAWRFFVQPDANWFQWSGLRYFLYEYEEYLSDQDRKRPAIGWEFFQASGDTTVEHILPQTPEKEYWKSRFAPKDIELHLHDIGNLCLTEDNSVYSNKAFPDKKGHAGQGRCYANANLFQERELCQLEDWTPESVIARKRRLIEWAYQRWHIAGVTDTGGGTAASDDQVRD